MPTAAADRTRSRRHRAGSRRNKKHRTVGTFGTDLQPLTFPIAAGGVYRATVHIRYPAA